MDVEFNVKVLINGKRINQNIKKTIDTVQARLDAQILKDSNYYCPMYTGTLQKSAILHSVLGSGRLIWQTPYAREQYYGKPNKSHQHNPNACMEWFEAAKAKRLNVWVKLANAEYIKNS